ncbi:MAG: GNAT family N-acetyltransferase [Frankiales bacterium]|nr:GNAT family N-acetyltransferase [Frankiales bacterium]
MSRPAKAGETVSLVDAETFASIVTDAAHLYGEAMQRSPELVVQRREIMQSHVHRRGLVATVATAESGELIGFGYGYRGRAGEWWHDVVAKALGREAARRWLSDAFEIAELHVTPAAQGHGLGRRLLAELLVNGAGRTVVLSTHDRESAARALYRSVGFDDLLRGFVFPGSTEVYAVMGLER